MTKVSRFLLIAASALLVTACKKDNNPSPPPEGKQEDIAAVDQKVTGWMTTNKMPGVSLAVSRNGKLVYAKGYGVTSKETNEKVTTESQFRIASVSKLITSAAIMNLVEDGKIALDQKIFGTGALLGTTYGTQPYKQYVTDVTVSDLLHHTIGGWGQDNDPAFFDISMDKTAIINYALSNITLVKKPGTSFAYSNLGYILLSAIIEKASGKAYAQYVNDEILAKTGATHTAIAGSKLTDRLAQEVVYTGQGDDIPYVYGMDLLRGDGAMGWLSTPTDLLRFATAVDSSTTRPDILSPSTIKTMVTTTPASSGLGFHFGCGWVVEGNEWFWWGSLPGTFAVLYRIGNGICIAATANSRVQPSPNNGLFTFVDIINYIAFENSISWQDTDQF